MFYFILFNMRNYIHILKNALFQNFETDQFLATLKKTKIIDFRQLFCIFLVVNVLILSTLTFYKD